MPKLKVEGVGTFEVPMGKRLVLALIDEAKIDQMHSCGGNSRCTTCRVQFIAGEPDKVTQAERDILRPGDWEPRWGCGSVARLSATMIWI